MATIDDINNVMDDTRQQQEKLAGIAMQQEMERKRRAEEEEKRIGQERESRIVQPQQPNQTNVEQPAISEKQQFYPSTENNFGANVQQQDNGNAGASPAAPATPSTPAGGGSMTFQDMYRKLNTYQPPTEEELEKERKKQKRDMLMASIGNGFNAFHQAYANARGIKPVTENVSLTGKVRDRYEKIQKERDALSREYANGMLRAAQMDQEQSNWREKLEYQKGRDAKADERDQRNFDYTKEQDKQKQENWQKTFDRQSEQWQQEFKQREQQYGRQNALAWASHNLAVQAQKDNNELREKSINAQAAKGVRGKQLAFTDGNGNNFNIYENVWKGSMEQVYDAIVAEFEAQKKNNSNADVPRGLPRKATAQQKDDFVKQHWHKSEAGRRMMQTLAGIDPASMVNTSGNYDQYEVKQDDYSQYEVK